MLLQLFEIDTLALRIVRTVMHMHYDCGIVIIIMMCTHVFKQEMR